MKNTFPTTIQRKKLIRLVQNYLDGVSWPILKAKIYPEAPPGLLRLGGFTERALNILDLDVCLVIKAGTPDRIEMFSNRKSILYLGKAELIRSLHEIGHALFGVSEKRAIKWSEGLLLEALSG